VSVGDDFVQYLTELGIGTPGINLWLGGVPDRAAAITVVETAVRLRIMTTDRER